MSLVNFKLVAEIKMKDRLEKIQNGEIRFDFSNQHDGHVLEDALRVLENDPDAVEEYYEKINDNWMNCDATTIAYALSRFQPEEPSRAWTD